MKVTVKTGIQEQFIGFFDHIRRRPGDVFTLPDQPRRALFPAERKLVDTTEEGKAIFDSIKDGDGKIPVPFSFRWMEPVAQGEVERTSTSQQALNQKSKEIKQEKAGQRALDAGKTADVL